MFHKIIILLLLGHHILGGKIILYETFFINRLTGIFLQKRQKNCLANIDLWFANIKKTAILLTMTFGQCSSSYLCYDIAHVHFTNVQAAGQRWYLLLIVGDKFNDPRVLRTSYMLGFKLSLAFYANLIYSSW
jgi:hypothetical protein